MASSDERLGTTLRPPASFQHRDLAAIHKQFKLSFCRCGALAIRLKTADVWNSFALCFPILIVYYPLLKFGLIEQNPANFRRISSGGKSSFGLRWSLALSQSPSLLRDDQSSNTQDDGGETPFIKRLQ